MAFIVPTNRELNENTEELNDEKLTIEKNKLKLDFIDGVSITSNPQNVSFNRNYSGFIFLNRLILKMSLKLVNHCNQTVKRIKYLNYLYLDIIILISN